jgi:hypothetical protein
MNNILFFPIQNLYFNLFINLNVKFVLIPYMICNMIVLNV